MNQVEGEHLVLKAWLQICHGDLDTVFLKIHYLIEVHIVEIKTNLNIPD